MSQLPFAVMFDSAEEATAAAISRSPKEFKEVAAMLYPGLSPASAYARLKADLNSAKPEKLTADEHIKIALFVGEFDFLYYAAGRCHHSQPQPVSPGDEQAELQRQFIAAANEMRKLMTRLDLGVVQPRPRAVG